MDKAFLYIQQHFAWIIAALALAVATVNYFSTKKRAQKSLTYQVSLDIPLVNKHQLADSKIQILYDGTPVDSVRLALVVIRNSGGKEIEAKDFVEPVRIIFEGASTVFESTIIDSSPSGFNPEIEQDGKTVLIKPTLMNTKDRFTVRVIVPQEEAIKVKVEGRISGVPVIGIYKTPEQTPFPMIIAFVLLVLSIIAQKFVNGNPIVVPLIGGAVMGLYGMYLTFSASRR